MAPLGVITSLQVVRWAVKPSSRLNIDSISQVILALLLFVLNEAIGSDFWARGWMDAQHDKDEQMGNAATFGSTPKINRVFFKNWTMYVQ